MMGRLAPAPKCDEVMPGSCSSVSPSVAARLVSKSFSSSTVTGAARSCSLRDRGVADTVTSFKVCGAGSVGDAACAQAAAGRPQETLINANTRGFSLPNITVPSS